MFGFSFDIFVNGDVSIGDDRLFKFTLTKEKRMAINFVKELIRLHDGILGFYRAKHVVLARYCYRKSSVRLSVCLSVCNVAVR